MKQNLFKLMMLFGLFIIANTAFGVTGDKFDPFVDSDHNYSLTYTLPAAGTVSLNITSTQDPTLAHITVSSLLPAELTSYKGVPSSSQVAGDYTLSFAINYSDQAVVGDVYNIKFVTNLTTGGCSNNIDVDVTIRTKPVYNIAIATATLDGCQELNLSPANNVDASVGSVNSITYTVTPSTAPDGIASYSYTVGITSSTFSPNCSTCGSNKTGTGNYTATFESVEGTGGTVRGSVSGTFTMTEAYGGGTYDMTATANDVDVTYLAMPTIGNATNGGFY